jgi:glyoxylase-like metal-dependent hydrolase (beta-lactamase superfamily II)
MQIGPYRVDFLDTGRFRLDGGAMFGVVPRVLWEKSNPPDTKNRIDMALRTMLIRGNGKVILVDSGIGTKWSEKLVDIYAIDHSTYQLDTALASVGCTRDEVTHVVLTHLHFDHVGGATRFDATGKAVLTFPNADYLVQFDNLGHAHAPSEKDKASFIEYTIKPLEDSGRLVGVNGEKEIAPGVHILVTHGHTPGHQLVKVSSKEETILFCGDTVPTASHIPIPWVMAYDLYPLTTMEEKRDLFIQAVKGNWKLAFCHDPKIAFCGLTCEDGKYRAV